MRGYPCPVCGANATKLHSADYDGHKFGCEACGGRFDVTGSVFYRLVNETLETRKGALAKAKKWSKSEIPAIDSRCL